MELRSLSMADAGGTSRETRRTEEAEGGGEWRGQGAGLGLGLSKTTSEGEVAHMQRACEAMRQRSAVAVGHNIIP